MCQWSKPLAVAGAHVSFASIFNALGEEVATLAHGEEPAGYKSVTWNGSNVASGVYFCRLQAVGVADPAKAFTQMRKLVLLR